jgi:hypothetical protein
MSINNKNNSNISNILIPSSNTSIDINSNSLTLEELTMEYQNVLMKYNNVKSDYINSIKNIYKNTDTSNNFVNIPNKTFLASTNLLDSSANTIQECQALCSSNIGCYGATFKSDTNICTLTGSDGDIVKSSDDNNNAIISQSFILLKQSQYLNNKLIKINKKIANIVSMNKKTIFNNNKKSNKKSQTLLENANVLNKERAVIEQTLDEFKDLEENEVEGDLITNSNYYSFILLLFLVIVFILCLLFFSFTSKSSVTTSSNSGNQFSNLFNMK